jgi:murein tripeptide amidase MpaA
LRGNQPKLQFQYLTLRKQGKVSKFLKFYPENKNELSMFRDQIHLFTNTLYENYVSCYIKKEKSLKDFSHQYKTHIYNIHQIYWNELREQKKNISLNTVINYVNNLEPTLLMFSLNYNFRQYDIDVINNQPLNC